MKGFNETEYLLFRESLRGIIIKIIIGFILGFAFTFFASSDMGFGGACLIGVFFAGIPYAWTKMPVILGGWMGLAITFIICLFLGWIITPIALIYNLIQCHRYKKRVLAENIDENSET